MPASSRPVPVGAGDNVWHRHEAEIKDLYQNQRKTLREVKLLMEENGFPKTPLSTWESQLRERLQLRKKAKSHDWPLIYQHIVPRLKHPRKKRLKRRTTICLHGSEIPWDKAWKEIRRSGALEIDSNFTSTSALPPGITIRTPSPGPCTSPPTARGTQPVISDMSTCSNRTTSLAVVPLQNSVAAPTLQTRSLMYSFSVYLLQWCASTIPWLEMCQSIQYMFHGEKHTRQLEILFSSVVDEFLATSAIARAAQSQIRNEIISSETRLDLLRDDRPIPPRPSPDLGYRVARSRGQNQLSQFILTAIFLLSNRLHDREDGDGGLELLCSLLDRDAFLITTLLRSHAPSVRAAWESLFKFSMEKRRRVTFRALTDIGIRNHWLVSLALGDYLLYAVVMDCYDTVTKILGYYRDSDCSHWWRHSFRAILAACGKGNVECASLLIQHCDVNATEIRLRNDPSMFQELVESFERSDIGTGLALELFLANGANVDKDTCRRFITKSWTELVGRDKNFDATRPTILDEVFYLNRPLFDKLSPFSRVPGSRITRTGLLVALEDGSQTLRDYLSARQSVISSFNGRHVQSLLELLLAEQFKISKRVDLRIVRNLCEFGVDFNTPSVEFDIQDFWRAEDFGAESFRLFYPNWRAEHFDFAWHQFSDVNDRIELLSILLTRGGLIGERVLEGVVAQYGTGGLECLAVHLTDFPTKAIRALVRAARLNNFEDVGYLLRKGVNPNAFTIAHGRNYSILAVATQAFLFGTAYQLPDGGCSLEMMQFLARHGARLVLTPEDSTPFDFANNLLRESRMSDLFAKIEYVLGTLTEDRASSRLPSFLLESCIAREHMLDMHVEDEPRGKRLEIFEYLFRQGAEVSPGSPLAALIHAGGREGLVRDVLYSGSDLNAYWGPLDNKGSGFTPLQAAAHKGNESLVRLLLQEGANVNSPPYGRRSSTALQAICRWPPASEEEHQRKIRICRLLVDQGADVNLPNFRMTFTVLGEAALIGDLELAALLLREGADVNASSACGTALDNSASYGRLDMAKFLLSANGLSARRGATGYDDAISMAEINGYSAVADLIREHAAKVEAGTVFNPELLKKQEVFFVDGFGTDFKFFNYKPFPSDHAEDVGAAGGTSEQTDTDSGYREAAHMEPLADEQVVPGGSTRNHSNPGFVLSEEDQPMESEGVYIQCVETEEGSYAV